MTFDVKFGLEQGIHTRQGRKLIENSSFIDDIIDSCRINDFLVVRGFNTGSEPLFYPKVVLIGVQYDGTIVLPEKYDGNYFNIRVKNILLSNVKPKSIFIGEGNNKRLVPDDKLKYQNTFWHPFIGTYEIRLVGDPVTSELENQGIAGVADLMAETNAKKHLCPEIMKAVNEKDIAGMVFAVMHFNYFINDGHILKTLETNNISYVLLCPKTVYLSKNIPTRYINEEIQKDYERVLKLISNIDFNHDAMTINEMIKFLSEGFQ